MVKVVENMNATKAGVACAFFFVVVSHWMGSSFFDLLHSFPCLFIC